MGKFDGKILLELGTNVGSVEIVEYARSEGAYVIVADYLEPDKSAAKAIADEHVLISTLDVDALYDFAKARHIDGIFCGVSELNLFSAMQVAERLNLPFYFNRRQWELMQNKKTFKDLCIKNNIPVPKEYVIADINDRNALESINFPVIVKPVDQGAAIGIHICNNVDELIKGYNDAKEKSFCGQVVVEQYIKGMDFSVYYTFIDGKCAPSIAIDKYICKVKNDFTPLPEAYVFPSKIQEKYLNEINKNVEEMFLSIGFKNGVACVQCVFDENGMYVFECGLRIGGNALYRFVEHVNKNNFLKMSVDYSLLGKITDDLSNEDVYFKGKHGCVLSLLNRGGVIGKIEGYEDVSKWDGVIYSELRYKEGDSITKNGTLKQSHIRFFLVYDSKEELAQTIRHIKDTIKVTDVDGNDMIYSDLNPNDLF